MTYSKKQLNEKLDAMGVIHDPDSPVNELKSPQSVRVNCSKLALRSCPSKNSPMIDVLEEGAEFTAEEFESEWLYVPDRDGYVMREFVEAL